MKKKNNVMAMLIAVLVVIAMMPAFTQEAYADVELDFSKHVSGLKDGKIEIGTTLSVNVKETIDAYTVLKEAYNVAGSADVVLKTYSPSDTRYFSYDSTSGVASLYVSKEIANVGYKVEVWIVIGGTIYYIPGIDVVEKPASPPAEKAANALSVSGKAVTVKYKKLKKKNQYLDAAMAFAFANEGQGGKTFSLISVKKGKKSFKKYFKIDSSTGRITVKKKLKKGTYKMKVAVQASGDANYNPSAVQTVTIKIKVK